MTVLLVVREVIIAGERNTYIGAFPHVVATLLVFDDLVLLGFAATERNTAGLPGADCLAGAVEVDVHVPVLQYTGWSGWSGLRSQILPEVRQYRSTAANPPGSSQSDSAGPDRPCNPHYHLVQPCQYSDPTCSAQ